MSDLSNLFLTRHLPVFAPEDGAGDAPAEASSEATPAAPEAGAPEGAPVPAKPEAPAAAPEPGAGRWWEDRRFNADQRRTIEATGLTTEDPLDAVRELTNREIAAKKRLGASPDSLMPKPTQGQEAAAWRREHAAALGIPETGADYDIPRPEGWPKELPWDESLEAGARALAEKHAADPALVKEFSDLYAARTMEIAAEVDERFARAQADLMATLERDWGDQMDGKLLRAQRAMAAAADAAGLGDTEIQELTGILEKKTAPANVARLFAAIGDMMAEDSLTGAGQAPSLSVTPAEARAQIAQMTGVDGAWYKATQAKDRRELDRLKPIMDDLYKRAAR